MCTISSTHVCNSRVSCAEQMHGMARLNDRNNVIPILECENMFLLVLDGDTEDILLVLLQASNSSPKPLGRRLAQPDIYRPKPVNAEIGEAQI